MAAPSKTRSGRDLHGWAREELGVETGTPTAELRAAFLRRVAEEEFVPPEDWRRAYAVLAPAATPGRHPDGPAARDAGKWVAAREWAEGCLREEVEEFAERLFELASAERRQHRDRLLSRCDESQALAARLLALDAGLAVDEAKVVNPRLPARALAGYLCGLFILRPEERPSRRAAFRRLMLADSQWKAADWEEAGKYLRRKHPDIAALDPELLQPLSARVDALRYNAKGARTPSNSGPASQSTSRWPWWVVLGIVTVVFRFIGVATKDHSTPSVPAPSFPSVPPLTPQFPVPPGVDPTRPGQRDSMVPTGPFSTQLVFWRLQVLTALQDLRNTGRIGPPEQQRLERIVKEVRLPPATATDTYASVRRRFFEAYFDRVAAKQVVAGPVLAELRERLLAGPAWRRPQPNPARPPQPGDRNPPTTKAKPTAPTSRGNGPARPSGPMSQAPP